MCIILELACRLLNSPRKELAVVIVEGVPATYKNSEFSAGAIALFLSKAQLDSRVGDGDGAARSYV